MTDTLCRFVSRACFQSNIVLTPSQSSLFVVIYCGVIMTHAMHTTIIKNRFLEQAPKRYVPFSGTKYLVYLPKKQWLTDRINLLQMLDTMAFHRQDLSTIYWIPISMNTFLVLWTCHENWEINNTRKGLYIQHTLG